MMMLKTSHMCRSIVMMALIMIMMMSTSDMYRLVTVITTLDSSSHIFIKMVTIPKNASGI